MDDQPRLKMNIVCACGKVGEATIYLNEDRPYDPPSIAGTLFTCDQCGAKLRISLDLRIAVPNSGTINTGFVSTHEAPKMN